MKNKFSIFTISCMVAFLSGCDFINFHMHKYGEWEITTEPTCTTSGVKTRKCSECGKEETNVVPSLGHQKGEPEIKNLIQPTIEHTGSCDEIYYCVRCGVKLGEEHKVLPKAVPVTDISFDKSEYFVDKDETVQLNITISPVNGDKRITWTSEDTEIATVSQTGLVTGVSKGYTYIKATSVNGIEKSVKVTVSQTEAASLIYSMNDYGKNCAAAFDNLEIDGDSNILVVPMWFTDSSNYVDSTMKAKVRGDLQKAFFGTSEDTGWESVSSYYEKESMGKAHITGVVSEYWNCGYSYNDARNCDANSYAKQAASWYKTNYGSLSQFDANKNGYIDATVVIYMLPDSAASGDDGAESLWAYVMRPLNYAGTSSNPVVGNLMFASYDFMYSAKDSTYYHGDTSHCLIDAHAFIHETGHLFGLDDYYDYNDVYEAAGQFTMQDYNVGGHDPASLMMLGWASAYVPTKSTTLTIRPSVSTGEMIVLSPEFHNSPFDEYILIDLYTPTGLNQFDSTYAYKGDYPMGSPEPGIRVWHVDTRMTHYSSSGVFSKNLDYKANKSCFFAMSNTNYKAGSSSNSACSPLGTGYYDYKALQLIRYNHRDSFNCGDQFNEFNIFKTDATFDMNTFGKCFVNEGKLNSGLDLGWSFTVKSVSTTEAKIEITKL